MDNCIYCGVGVPFGCHCNCMGSQQQRHSGGPSDEGDVVTMVTKYGVVDVYDDDDRKCSD